MQLFSDEDKIGIAKSLLFELIERISRFHLHLEDIRDRFYPSKNFKTNQRNSNYHLLDPYYDCLVKLLRCSCSLSLPLFNTGLNSKNNNLDAIIEEIQNLINLTSKLHIKLGFLPRPPEPPELRRFGRVLGKHSMKLSQSKKYEISIYIDEYIAEETLYVDPLAEFKDHSINAEIDEINKIVENITIEKFKNELDTAGFHVTIPRIDACNSCRWPTLVHELAHKILKSEPFKEYHIKDEFERYFKRISKDNEYDIYASNKIDIPKWLEECWCDLLGAMVMGPAFWFSQASVFIFAGKSEDFGKIQPTHPPYLFRLLLITNILRHRFNEPFSKGEKSLNLYRKIFDYFDTKSEDGFLNNPFIRYIYDWFKTFFIEDFFSKDSEGKLSLSTPLLNNHISFIIKYTSDIKADVIDNMISSLEVGAPIPSYRIDEDISLQERPSHVQEVLLAAWIFRNNKFKDNILKEFANLLLTSDLSLGEKILWNKFCDVIVKKFKEFNFSVLRSIQVGEWFDLLGGEQDIIDFDKLKEVSNVRLDPCM